MPITDAYAASLLDLLVNGVALAAPNRHLALSTADPTSDGSGLAEPVGNGYARVDLATLFGAASSATRDVTTDTLISFPTASGGSWGTITHWAIMDAGSGGNAIWEDALTTPKTVADGETFEIPVGDLTLSLPP
jgi:hypothetical protein